MSRAWNVVMFRRVLLPTAGRLPPTPHGQKQGMLEILLIVLIVLLLFGGGGYYWRGRGRGI